MLRQVTHEIKKPSNPFETQIWQKVRSIETYQTQRTATELFDILYQTIECAANHLHKPIFREHRYLFSATDSPLEKLGLLLRPNGIYTAQYKLVSFGGHDITNVIVSTAPVHKIPQLRTKIFFGQISPTERLPLSASLNGRSYDFFHSGRIVIPGEIGFS